MTEIQQSLKNIENSILNLETKCNESRKALHTLLETEAKLQEKILQFERELKVLYEMRDGAMKPLPMKKRKWSYVSGMSECPPGPSLDVGGVDLEDTSPMSGERPLKRRRGSFDSEYSDESEMDREGSCSPTSANSTIREGIDHDLNSLVDDTTKRLPHLLSSAPSTGAPSPTIPCSTICHAYPVPTTIELIEGFNYKDVGVQPGGKRNSAKDTLPQQVIELKGYYKEAMGCKVEVLGLIKKHNRMEVIGFLDRQKFVQTADNRYLAMFNNCCCRFSSHSYGQKLALRFTLMDEDKEVCSVDSKCFQTITRRGREKQNKKLAQKGGWSQKHILQLLEGVKKYGHNSFPQILKSYDWEQWQTLPVLQKKYLQLLKA